MKLTIGVMGASGSPDAEVEQNAFRAGRAIAESQAVLITGATNGLPLAAARGAKDGGGEVIGFSPAINWMEHQRQGLPVDFHDLIICTGLSAAGRNILNVRASHGLLFIGGSTGALNEFTLAYDENKIIGILVGSGGFCNHLEDWMRHLSKPGNRSILIYSADPRELVGKVIQSIHTRKTELGL